MRQIRNLISLCIVYFLMIGLYFFNSILSGVFFLFLVVTYLEVPGSPEFLCSVHSSITCILFPFFAMTYIDNVPFSLAFLITALMPYLLIDFKAEEHTLIFIHLSSSGI